MDSIEHRGVWWLPDKPGETVGGILSFSQQDGGKLELFGTFPSASEGNEGDYSIILGTTVDGKFVTLRHCSETNRVISTSGLDSTAYLARFIFIGDHIANEESLRFHKLQARFTYLFDWAGISGISRELFDNGQKIQFTYETPEDISIAVPDGRLDFTFGANIKSAYDLSHIKEKASIFIEFNEDKSFNEFATEYLFPLQALVSLGTTKANYVEELYLFPKDSPNTYLTTYYSQHFYQTKVEKQLFRPDMLFTLADIHDDLETKINKWFVSSKEIDSVFHLLRRVRISPELFLELRFLSLAQAIETYHRTTRNNHVMPKEAYEKRVRNILLGLSEPDEGWLSNILKHANEPRLADRLKEFLIQYKEVINPQIKNPQDSNGRRKSFVRAVTQTRNYYTHFDKDGEAEALKGADLHYLTEKLMVLLEACLLGELGISPDQQPDLFRQNDRYNRLTSK